ncbi:MAG: ABC transporter permease [Planctomycetia bacterium]|nr:ABC transporter permease [Planctomycetia bacterium]
MNRLSHVLKLALRNLAAQRLRSLLTVLGIVLGVASVIIMLAVGEAARFEAIEQIRQLGATNIIIRSAKPTADEKKERQQQFVLDYGLKSSDLNRIQTTIPTVTDVTATREFIKEVRYLDRKMDARIVAATPEQADQANLRMAQGRFITEKDDAGKANVCVLGHEVAERLFPYEDPMNKAVRIDGSQYYRIIGVTEQRGASKPGVGEIRDYDKEIYIPFNTDRVRTGGLLLSMKAGSFQAEKLELSQITVSVDKLENVKGTAEVISCLMEQFHPEKDYAITVPLDLLEKAERTQRIFSLVLGAIASISLVVGGIGIMNIMLATVTERTREIGIRRALGARRSDITSQFLAESVVLTSLGGLVGVGLGIGGSLLVTRFFELPTIITPWSAVVAFAVSVLTGLIFGIYPARRAAWMDPIEALRHE